MAEKITTLDVREDIRNGCEPFSTIMATVAQLRPDENLLLLTPFEPVPLFAVLANQGFGHTAREMENGDWEVLFTRRDKELAAEHHAPLNRREMKGGGFRQVVEVDARGLEPPQPMVKILETLAALPGGAEIRAHTDRRPMHLYAQLEARGFTGRTEEQTDGSFITHIRRN